MILTKATIFLLPALKMDGLLKGGKIFKYWFLQLCPPLFPVFPLEFSISFKKSI